MRDHTLSGRVPRGFPDAAHAQGFGQLDMAGVTRLYEQWTGVAVRGAAARDARPGAG